VANPQPDEFTRISNELLEAILLSNFTKRQLNIILLVIRLTYGCGRKYAVLRKSDFEVAGIDKSDIKRELDLLVRSGVLIIDGDRISLNKDYDRWRISLVRAGSREEFKKILQRNLQEKTVLPTGGDQGVGKTPTDQCDQVGKTPTDELAKHQPTGWQNTNQMVGKIPTDQETQPNGANELSGVERNIKETLKKSKENPPYNPPQGGSVGFIKIKERECVKTAPVEMPLNSVDEDLDLVDRTGDKAMGETPQEEATAPTVGKAAGKADWEYDQDFLKFWAEYPRKTEKQRAYRCWKTRIREGLSEGLTMEGLVRDLVDTAKNYAADCRKRRTEERYIKHASTFLGPDRPYLDWISKSEAKQEEKGKETRKELIKSLYLS